MFFFIFSLESCHKVSIPSELPISFISLIFHCINVVIFYIEKEVWPFKNALVFASDD